jgi:hypothetical protein
LISTKQADVVRIKSAIPLKPLIQVSAARNLPKQLMGGSRAKRVVVGGEQAQPSQ